MATTSSTGGTTIACSKRSSSSGRLIDSTSRYRSSKVLLLARVKPSFCVRCVSSEPKPRLRDPVTEEGVVFLSIFFLFFR